MFAKPHIMLILCILWSLFLFGFHGFINIQSNLSRISIVRKNEKGDGPYVEVRV